MNKGSMSPLGYFNNPTFERGFENYIQTCYHYLDSIGVHAQQAYLIREIFTFKNFVSLKVEDQKAVYSLLLIELIERSLGSSYIPVDSSFYFDHLNRFMEEGEARALSQHMHRVVKDSFEGLVGQRGDAVPLIVEDKKVYSHKMLRREERLAEQFAKRFDWVTQNYNEDRWKQVASQVSEQDLGHGVIQLSEKQQEAVKVALSSPMSVIMGGPGTGKTTVISSILQAFVLSGTPLKSIALAAPTGKAAQRLSQVAQGVEAVTLHRLLGYQPRRNKFDWHQNRPLRVDVVIVDEASMVDSFLMFRLFQALEDSTQLVLMGDPDQLPSVDPGSVLSDLKTYAKTHGTLSGFVTLDQNYRMSKEDEAGGHILSMADHVREQDTSAFMELLKHDSPFDLMGQGVQWIDPKNDLLEKVLEVWHQDLWIGEDGLKGIRHRYSYISKSFSSQDKDLLATLFKRYQSNKVLCMPKFTDYGSQRVNLHCQLLTEKMTLDRHSKFKLGDPVMYLRNDVKRGLFNGALGLVLDVEDDRFGEGHKVVFLNDKDEFVVWPIEVCEKDIELNYAMTVHKSQGSEFNKALLILPKIDMPILSQEIVYTAVTRCKNSVHIFGDKAMISQGIQRKLSRRSDLVDKIRRCNLKNISH